MKTGRSLQELAMEITRQARTKRDFIVSTESAELATFSEHAEGGRFGLQFPVGGTQAIFAVGDIAHAQIAERLEIPKRYYDRMRVDYPELLVNNVNSWFRKEPEKRMVRTLDGRARAFLSSRYRPVDHYDVAEHVLPLVAQYQWDVKACEVTETRMYLKVVSEQIRAEVRPAVRDRVHTHVVHPGFIISNSEVGMGALKVQPTVHWEHCLNLAVMGDYGAMRNHIGKDNASMVVDGGIEFFTNETRRLDDAAFWAKTRDLIGATLSTEVFKAMVEKFTKATEMKIEGRPTEAIEVFADKFQLSKSEKDGVLDFLIRGGDFSLYGLSGAVTRYSQDVQSFDRATELEQLGGSVIELSARDWKEIAMAA